MSPERAFHINDMLTTAWFMKNGIYSLDQGFPDLSGITLQECVEATEFVRDHPPIPNPDGGQTIICHLDGDEIPATYAWVWSKNSLDRIVAKFGNN
jgi:hypothetical protein